MGEEHSTKNLVSRTETDPWNAILGRRPGSYKMPEVGRTLMNTIDFAVFERRLEKAIVTGVVFEKWAENERHFACKAPAVMSTVYSINGMRNIAEEKLIQARKEIRRCADCKAHYLKRNGIFLFHGRHLKESLWAYSQAVLLFEELQEDLEQAKCLMGRGIVKTVMHDYENGLDDQEAAMEILNGSSGHYIVVGAINSASILTHMGRLEAAREKVEEAQELLSGIKSVERPKLVLRWIKALLLEDTGEKKDRKLASQMIDRVEDRMRALDMQREIRVLLADRARIARAPHTIRRIARKALAMEDTEPVRTFIQAVIDNTSRGNIVRWRNALDSYVPPFSEAA